MTGIKLLFLAIWDEFKTLIFINLIPSRDKNYRAVQADSRAYQKRENANRNIRSSGHFSDRKSHDDGTSQKWSKPNKVEAWQFIFTVLTFGIGLCLARIYFKQMQANQTQATAAVNQFAVMTNQLNEMRLARETDERAWVNVFRVASTTNIYAPMKFEAHFNNTGKTPSKKTSAGIGATLDPDSIRFVTYDTNAGSQLLPPGVDSEVSCIFLLSDADRQDVLNGKKLIYVYGRISYEDIFNNRHWSGFCYVMDTIAKRTYPAPFGNDSDDAQEGAKK